MSDWISTTEFIKAGLDLEMPCVVKFCHTLVFCSFCLIVDLQLLEATLSDELWLMGGCSLKISTVTPAKS